MSNPKQFDSLNALRGIAALGVAIFHFKPNWPGYLAVDFFFVLSGFILAHSYFLGGREVSFRLFLWHRVARLYPLHLFSLGVFVLVHWLLFFSLPSYPSNPYALIQHLLLINNIGLGGDELTFNEPSWSISVEFFVNLLFFIFLGFDRLLLVLGALGMLGLAFHFGHLDLHYQNLFGYVNAGLIRCVFSFAIGVGVYRWFLRRDGLPVRFMSWTRVECLVLAAVAILLMGRQDKLSLLDFAAPGVFAMVVFVFAHSGGWLSRQSFRLARLGEISYSVYLNQFIVLMVVRKCFVNMGWLPMFVIYILALMVVSNMTYRWVEQPARNYLRNKFDPVKSALRQ